MKDIKMKNITSFPPYIKEWGKNHGKSLNLNGNILETEIPH